MIDHKTCGHVNHTTLDHTRHQEMHSAILRLVVEWSSAANHAEHDGDLAEAMAYRNCVDDLVKAMHPFEIEQ